MASTVHLEFDLAGGGTLTIDVASDGPVSPDELSLVVRVAEMLDRSTATRARPVANGA